MPEHQRDVSGNIKKFLNETVFIILLTSFFFFFFFMDEAMTSFTNKAILLSFKFVNRDKSFYPLIIEFYVFSAWHVLVLFYRLFIPAGQPEVERQGVLQHWRDILRKEEEE